MNTTMGGGAGLANKVADTLPQLCLQAYGGSSWAALLVAIHVKAKDLDELMRAVGIGPATRSPGAFDACCDGFRVYQDAVASGADI